MKAQWYCFALCIWCNTLQTRRDEVKDLGVVDIHLTFHLHIDKIVRANYCLLKLNSQLFCFATFMRAIMSMSDLYLNMIRAFGPHIR